VKRSNHGGRPVLVVGLVAVAALMGCGDAAGGGADATGADAIADTQVADVQDAVESDVYVPGPGECELNWVSGFTPAYMALPPMAWNELDPWEVGVVTLGWGMVDGPGSAPTLVIQQCRMIDGTLWLSASSSDGEVLYSLAIELEDFRGPGVWMVGREDGMGIRFDVTFIATQEVSPIRSSAKTTCELCIDATGRQGAFRCDELKDETRGWTGAISFAGFICPDGEPGFIAR